MKFVGKYYKYKYGKDAQRQFFTDITIAFVGILFTVTIFGYFQLLAIVAQHFYK